MQLDGWNEVDKCKCSQTGGMQVDKCEQTGGNVVREVEYKWININGQVEFKCKWTGGN